MVLDCKCNVSCDLPPGSLGTQACCCVCLYVCTKVKNTAGFDCFFLLMFNYFKLEFMLLIIRSNCILMLLTHNINIKVYIL